MKRNVIIIIVGTLFLVFGSVMSGMVILISLARALYYMLVSRKMV